MDKRQKRSRKVICDALLSLMKDKPIEEITVKELTDKADVNRKTFYNNYNTIMDVKREMEDSLIELFFSLVDEESLEEKIIEADLYPGRFIHQLISVVDDDRAKAKMIFESGEDTIILMHVHKILLPHLRPLATEHGVTEQELEYALYFIASGTVAIIKAWLRGDISATSSEIETILTGLIKKVIR